MYIFISLFVTTLLCVLYAYIICVVSRLNTKYADHFEGLKMDDEEEKEPMMEEEKMDEMAAQEEGGNVEA
jgi:hypothetical protein